MRACKIDTEKIKACLYVLTLGGSMSQILLITWTVASLLFIVIGSNILLLLFVCTKKMSTIIILLKHSIKMNVCNMLNNPLCYI